MSLEYTERVKFEPTFYRSCFRGTVAFTGILIILNMALCFLGVHTALKPKPTQWIVTTVDGRLIKI